MDSSSSLFDTALERPLSDLVVREPLGCPPGTTVRAAVRAMNERLVGSIVVVGDAGQPVGIFTLRDLLALAAGDDGFLDRPVETCMTPDPVTLPPSASAVEAALLMAERGIRHVVLVGDRRFAGVVSERDLFRLQAGSPTRIAHAIRSVADVSGLLTLAGEAWRIGRAAVDQGLPASRATRLISSLNDLITRRVVELEFGRSATDGVEACWIALGSEGRGEQTLKTDQDNGIVFRSARPADAVRAELAAVADRVNRTLADCGIALCEGGIMAGNPKWCMSLDEWIATFDDWIVNSDATALMNCAIFFDFRPVCGAIDLADRLAAHLDRAVAANGRFLFQLARNALEREPALGVLRDFALERGGEHNHALDLKLHGTSLFVDAARVYALRQGIREVNTARRLRAAARILDWSAADADGWEDAFQWLQMLRLEIQRRAELAAATPSNHVDPDTLNPVERRMLLESLRQAKRLQQRLALDFRMLERGW